MSGSSKKSLKAALALGGGLVTVGLMAAMMTDDDGPPEDVVDGVQSTMNGLVDKAGGAVAAMAASVGEAVKSSLGGVLKTAPVAPSKTKKAKKRKTKTKAAAKARKARKREAKAARAAPVTPPKKRKTQDKDRSQLVKWKLSGCTVAVTPAPPRTEASESELALEGKVFEDEGVRWRIDEVYFDEDVKALCASYYDFDARGFVPPDDEDADLGVPRCCGAFTPSTRLASI